MSGLPGGPQPAASGTPQPAQQQHPAGSTPAPAAQLQHLFGAGGLAGTLTPEQHMQLQQQASVPGSWRVLITDIEAAWSAEVDIARSWWVLAVYDSGAGHCEAIDLAAHRQQRTRNAYRRASHSRTQCACRRAPAALRPCRRTQERRRPLARRNPGRRGRSSPLASPARCGCLLTVLVDWHISKQSGRSAQFSTKPLRFYTLCH